MNFHIILIIILSINVIAQISCIVSFYKTEKELDKMHEKEMAWLRERAEYERKEKAKWQ